MRYSFEGPGGPHPGTAPHDTMQHRQLKAPGLASALTAPRPWAAGRLAVLCAVALLASLPGAAGAVGVEFHGLSDIDYLSPLDDTPEGLPRAWRFASPGPAYQDAFGDPTVSVSVDPVTGLVREHYREQDVEIREPLVTPISEYNALTTGRNTRRLWREKFRNSRSISRDPSRVTGGMFRLQLPVRLPKAVRSIVGDGAPNLEVTGSETITISGLSDWTASKTNFTSERKRQGAFPSFEMKQELNVNLTGSIGDKIKVDVEQSSNVQTSLDNKVKLRYEGDEDDMIKTVELGNTNLSLQGASIRQEGLFGIKTAAKLGNWDVVTIASKQEGKNETARFTPSGDRTQVIIRDVDYIKWQYFSLTDHFARIDYDGSESGSGQRLEVYKKVLSSDKTGSTPGLARLDPTSPPDSMNPQVDEFWRLLSGPGSPTPEYTIEENHWQGLPGGLKVPVIRLVTRLSEPEVLAVAYTEITNGVVTVVGIGADRLSTEDPGLQKPAGKLLLKVIKQAGNELDFGDDGQYLSSDPWFPTLQYELRNFYDLGARNIATATMNLKVRKLEGGQAVNPDNIDQVPLIRILGLDQKDLSGQYGADGRVDLGQVDAEQGILFFPDIHPFDPTRGGTDLCTGPDYSLSCLNNDRWSTDPSLPKRPDLNTLAGETANGKLYTHRTLDFITDNRYYIEGEFQSSRQGYYLGRFNILEGSEVVKVDGIPFQRDTDYRIDYLTGQLTFMKVPRADQVISVDYSFAPGAGQVQRTLLGFSTSYNPSSDVSFSSSMLYESKGALEDLVKLGEEPATSMVGDLSTVLSFRPVWMTQLANKIPGIRSGAASALNFQGSFSASVPNPNTKGEAYIDDMEGNRESNTVPLNRTAWLWSSLPEDPALDGTVANHARLRWYNPTGDGNPYAVKEQDLKPKLTKEEGGENQRQALALDVVPPQGDSTAFFESMWTGITVPLATVGVDLTRVQYFEIWVNDFKSDHTLTRGHLHFNFGRINEDAFWDPRNPPNARLDSEDTNLDGRLDRRDPDDPTYLLEDEDTGLDGLHDEEEPGYTGSGDPNGDNYGYDVDENRDDYSRINNLDENAIDDPNARPDTEDLNRDGGLDVDNDYFERMIDLSDTQYVAIDVPKEFAGFDVVANRKDVPNGWRLYRIPIDSISTRVGSPSWANVQAVRIWVDSMTTPLRLQIGGIEMIGSRWLRAAMPDTNFYRDHEVQVLTRNNKDDPEYTPPYDVEHQTGISADRREQSLALQFARLEAGDSVLAFKTYSDVGNGIGWTQYGEIRFYAHGDGNAETQRLRAVARFGPDTVNYYEYSVPLRSGWQSVVIPMERLSGLKDRPHVGADSIMVVERDPSGQVFSVRGNPSFTRVNRVSLGIAVDSATVGPVAGEAWFNELRLSDVRKDRGFASNVTMQANFSDFLYLNGSFNQQDKDFFRVGAGANQGSGSDHTSTSLSSTLNLDRFMPTSGVQLPLRLSMQHSSDIPKFRTGSDVILDESRQSIEKRERNLQSIDVSYRRTGPKKGLARYTIDAIHGSMAYTREGSVSPQTADSSWEFRTNTSYTVPIGGEGVKVGPLRVNPVPSTVTLGVDWLSSRRASYSRTFEDSGGISQELRSDVKQRLLMLTMATALEPLSSVRMTYNLRSQRDMLLHQRDFFGFNKGTEIRHEQNVGVNYRPRWLTFLSPEIDLKGTYSEDAGPQVRLLPTDPTNLKRIQNSGSVHANIKVPVSRFGSRRGGARDSTGSFPLLAPLRFLFSRMQDVDATFDMTRSAVLDRVSGNAGLAFQTGFTEVFDDRIRRHVNSTFLTARRYSTRANTSFRPVEKLSFDLHGDYLLQFSDQVGGAMRSANTSWPDVNARWTDLQRMLGLNETLSALSVNSWFKRTTSESGPPDREVDQRIETSSFSPLLGWDATFRSGVRVNVASGFEKSRSTDNRAANFFRDRSTKNTRLQVNKTFPAAKGIRFPWSKKRVRLPNDLNLGVQADLGSDRSVINQIGVRETVEQDTGRLNVSSSTNYNSSPSISGGFNLAFRQTTDRKTNITQRGITMSFTGTFRF